MACATLWRAQEMKWDRSCLTISRLDVHYEMQRKTNISLDDIHSLGHLIWIQAVLTHTCMAPCLAFNQICLLQSSTGPDLRKALSLSIINKPCYAPEVNLTYLKAASLVGPQQLVLQHSRIWVKSGSDDPLYHSYSGTSWTGRWLISPAESEVLRREGERLADHYSEGSTSLLWVMPFSINYLPLSKHNVTKYTGGGVREIGIHVCR